MRVPEPAFFPGARSPGAKRVEVLQRFSKEVVILCQRAQRLGPPSEDDECQTMAAATLDFMTQVDQHVFGPLHATGVLRVHAPAQVKDHNHVPACLRRLVGVESPLGAGNPHRENQQPGEEANGPQCSKTIPPRDQYLQGGQVAQYAQGYGDAGPRRAAPAGPLPAAAPPGQRPRDWRTNVDTRSRHLSPDSHLQGGNEQERNRAANPNHGKPS